MSYHSHTGSNSPGIQIPSIQPKRILTVRDPNTKKEVDIQSPSEDLDLKNESVDLHKNQEENLPTNVTLERDNVGDKKTDTKETVPSSLPDHYTEDEEKEKIEIPKATRTEYEEEEEEEEDVKVTPSTRRYTKEDLLNLYDSNLITNDISDHLKRDEKTEKKRVPLPEPIENRWVAPRFVEDKGYEEQITMGFRRILNKITPEKYDDLLSKLLDIEMTTEFHFLTLINLIFEKATLEQKFAGMYSQLCLDLKSIKNDINVRPFRQLVANHCGIEFNKLLQDEEVLPETTDPVEIEIRELRALKLKDKKIGLMIFVGELYKRRIIKEARILTCLDALINSEKEDSLEQFCSLLQTVALDPKFTESKEWTEKESYFIEKMETIYKATGKFSSRLRFKFKDILESIENNWKIRGVAALDTGPKTLKDIKEEVERSKIEKKEKKVKQPQPKKVVSEDGWTSVTSKSSNRKKTTKPSPKPTPKPQYQNQNLKPKKTQESKNAFDALDSV